ncbi:MAG: hypothetical protein ABIF82_12855 [Planctomycetota bacterium]
MSKPQKEPVATDSGQAKPKSIWRRLMKIAVYLLVGVVVLCIAAAILFPIILNEDRLKSIIADVGGEALNGREVSVGSAKLDVFSGIKLGDLRVADRAGFSGADFVRVKEVDIRVDVWAAVSSFGKSIHVTMSVIDPQLVIERNAGGELNIADLLEPKEKDKEKKKKEPSEPLTLDELSLTFELTGGGAVLRDNFGGALRETTLSGLTVKADMPAIDQPLSYRVTAAVGEGRIEATGEPRLFHEGKADPAQIRGELLKTTISKFPAGAFAAHLGLPPMVKSVDGELRVAADEPGKITSSGKLAATSPHEGLGFGATLSSEADLKKRDALAKVTFSATPFSQGSFDLEVRDAGAKKLEAVGKFDLDLAKLTGSKAAKSLGMPTTADGQPATSKGAITGRMKISGTLTEIKYSLAGAINGFQAHPSLTGGTALPAEDASFIAEATLRLTPDGKPAELDVPVLEAKSSFLEAKISDGRLTSLADLKELNADLSGYARFSGRAFSSKFGKALGLPELHDKVAVTFSAKGEKGQAKVAANAKLEREQGAPEPVEFGLSAQVDAGGEKTKLANIEAAVNAGDAAAPYAQGTLAGNVADLTGDPNADLTFSGSVDVRSLAKRLAAYAKVLDELKPAGQIVVRDGKVSGTANALRAGFKAAARGLSVAAATDKTPGIPKELADILAKEEFLALCSVKADLTKNRVEIEALNVKSDMLAGGVTGTITDYAALRGAVDVTLAAKTDAIGPALAALKLTPKGIDTRGRAEFTGRVDTETGRAELKTLKATTPYVALALKEPGVVSGLDIAKLRKDPAAAAKSLSGNVRIEGTVLLDALAKLPPGVLPAELKAGGSVPFTFTLGKASPTKVELAANATGALLSYGDLFAKPHGGKAAFALVATLADGGGIEISNLEAEVDGARLKLAGALSGDFKTFTCKSMTANVDEPEKLAAMAPMLKDIKVTGKVDLTASGTVPVEQAAAGDLSGVVFNGVANVRGVRARYAPMPKLEVRAGGSIKLGSSGIDAGGFILTAAALPDKRDATLTFKELRVTSAKKNAPLLADLDALALTFSAHSPEINAGELLKALPQAEETGGDKPAPPPEQPGKKETKLDFAFLKKHRMAGAVTVGKLIYDRHVVSNIAAEFELRDNKFTMRKPFMAMAHQGAIEADVTADLNDPLIAHAGKIKVAKVDINSAVSSALPYDAVFEGKAGGEFAWKGQGYALGDIKRTWTGDGQVLIEDGVIANFEKSPRWVAVIGGFIIKHLGANAFPGDKYRYGELRLNLHLAKGKVKSEVFVLHGTDGLDFEVSDAWGDLDGNAGASATVLVPVERAMSYISREFKPAKQPRVEAIIREKLTKSRPSFCAISVARQDGEYQIAPNITILKWVTSQVGDLLRDPRSIIEGLLKEKLDEKREKDRDKKDPKKDAIKNILDGLLR